MSSESDHHHEDHAETCWICDRVFCSMCHEYCPNCGEPGEWGPTVEEEREAAKENATRIRTGRRYHSRFFILLVFLLVWARPSFAAYSFVRSGSAGSSDGTAAPSLTLDTTGGNFVFMAISENPGCHNFPHDNQNPDSLWTELTFLETSGHATVGLYALASPTVYHGNTVFTTNTTTGVCYASIAVLLFSAASPTSGTLLNHVVSSQCTNCQTLQAGSIIFGDLTLSILTITQASGTPTAIDAPFTLQEAHAEVGGASYGLGVAYTIGGSGATNPQWTLTGTGANAVQAANVALNEQYQVVSIYWVSPTASVSRLLVNCAGTLPLAGTDACALTTAAANATGASTVYLRGGTYSFTANNIVAEAFRPLGSGSCPTTTCMGGVGATILTFAAYTGETPVIEQATATGAVGLALYNNNWTRISGITFHNFTNQAIKLGQNNVSSSYNEIDHNTIYSDLANAYGQYPIQVGDYNPPWSTHNWIHHNYVSMRHNFAPCAEGVDLIRLGNAQANTPPTSYYSADDYNTVENNYVEYGAHTTIATLSKHNNIINNIVHNEPWIPGCTSGSGTLGAGWSNAPGNFYGNWPFYTINPTTYNGLFAHRNFTIGDADQFDANDILVEGNRIGFAAINPNNGAAEAIAMQSPKNIIRYNYMYGNQGSGVFVKSPNCGGVVGCGGTNNHVFNNTIFHNGYGWDAAAQGHGNLAYNGQGIAQGGTLIPGVGSNNYFTNNLVYDNGQGDICATGWYAAAGQPPPGGTVCSLYPGLDFFVNNWTTANGNPLFVNPDVTNPLSQNLFPNVHGYTATPIPNLALQTTSPVIDQGVNLTTATAAGTNSTTLTVTDAGFFQDGTTGSDLARGVTFFPDVIAIGSVANTVSISAIDRTTNTITLASPKTWSNGDKVWLHTKSDGVVVLNGIAPDIGAYETPLNVLTPITFIRAAAAQSPNTLAGTVSVAMATPIGNANVLVVAVSGYNINTCSVTPYDSYGNSYTQIASTYQATNGVYTQWFISSQPASLPTAIGVAYWGLGPSACASSSSMAVLALYAPILPVSVVSSASSTGSAATIAAGQVSGGAITLSALTTSLATAFSIDSSFTMIAEQPAVSGVVTGLGVAYKPNPGNTSPTWTLNAPDITVASNISLVSPPDTIPPTISITSPAAGANVNLGSLTATATATDNVGVTSLQFTLDGQNIGSPITSPPYTLTNFNVGPPLGSRSLGAYALDAANNRGNAAPVNINVVDTVPPTITMTSPTAGMIIPVGGTLNFVVTATDNVAVARVDFIVDNLSNPVGSVTTPSTPPSTYTFAYTVSNTPGSHSAGAVAYDTSGNFTYSAFVNVTVADTTPPTISITAPPNNTTLNQDMTLNAAATASDNVAVASVQFTLDGVAIGPSLTTAPYQLAYPLTTTPAGARSLGAYALDTSNNRGNASPVTINVVYTDTTPPTVSITAPAVGDQFFGSIPKISANATDDVAVQSVQFSIDGIARGPLIFVPPYEMDNHFIFDLAAGSHTLTATAWDTHNNSANSTLDFSIIAPGLGTIGVRRYTTGTLNAGMAKGPLVQLSY